MNRHVVKIEDADIKKASDLVDRYRTSIEREKSYLEPLRQPVKKNGAGIASSPVRESETAPDITAAVIPETGPRRVFRETPCDD